MSIFVVLLDVNDRLFYCFHIRFSNLYDIIIKEYGSIRELILVLFRKIKDKEVDISSLNDILSTGKKLVQIGYVMAIIALVLLVTYLIKEWQVLQFVG